MTRSALPCSFALFALILLLNFPASAQNACNCTPAPFEARWREAAAVFVGTVESIKVIEVYRKPSARDLPVEVTFLVDDGYKNAKTGGKFTLHTSLTFDTCTGHPFEEWKKYVVFAYERKAATFEYWSLYNFPSGTYDVGGLCGGTKLVDTQEAAMDLAPLRALQKEAEERAKAKEAEEKK